MRRLFRGVVSAVLIAGSCLLAVVEPASAGGSSWVFERERYQAGESAFVWAPVAWAHDPSLGTPEEGPYHAYVLPASSDPTATPIIDGSATPVGDITVSLAPFETAIGRFGPHHAELTFSIPNLPPGRYVLAHANDAGKFVGDLSVLTSFWIDAPLVTARPTLTG